jgi:hypothetical protein
MVKCVQFRIKKAAKKGVKGGSNARVVLEKMLFSLIKRVQRLCPELSIEHRRYVGIDFLYIRPPTPAARAIFEAKSANRRTRWCVELPLVLRMPFRPHGEPTGWSTGSGSGFPTGRAFAAEINVPTASCSGRRGDLQPGQFRLLIGRGSLTGTRTDSDTARAMVRLTSLQQPVQLLLRLQEFRNQRVPGHFLLKRLGFLLGRMVIRMKWPNRWASSNFSFFRGNSR